MNSSTVSVDRSSFVVWSAGGDWRVYRFEEVEEADSEVSGSYQMGVQYKLLLSV